MIKISRTVILDGASKVEYDQIVAHLEATASEEQGWKLHKEPLINKVTATKTEELQEL